MSPFKDNSLELCLFNYVHATENQFDKSTKPAVESAVEFQIPIGHAKKVMKDPFSGDGSKSAMDHLDFIESLCSLFKLAGIPHYLVKIRMLYMSLSGNARIWYQSLDEEDKNDWEVLRKVFYLKYYTPRAMYEDRCFIYNFWPHKGESISQAWGRLKELLCKNPMHGFSEDIILINFYVRLPKHHKDILDNSSGGSFTNNKKGNSWELLETISQNAESWGLD